MTTNLDIARRFMERGIALADMTAFDECLSPDIAVRTGLSPAGPILGLAAYKQIFSEFARALPVIDFVIHEIWPSPDNSKVIVRFTATAVFLTDYFGVIANRQIVAMEEVHILEFTEGKIVGNVVSGTNFPFEYLMYPVLKDAVVGAMQIATEEQIKRAEVAAELPFMEELT